MRTLIIKTDSPEELFKKITSNETLDFLNAMDAKLRNGKSKTVWRYNGQEKYFQFSDYADTELKLRPEIADGKVKVIFEHPYFHDSGSEIFDDIVRCYEDFVLMLLRDHNQTIKSIHLDLRSEKDLIDNPIAD